MQLGGGGWCSTQPFPKINVSLLNDAHETVLFLSKLSMASRVFHSRAQAGAKDLTASQVYPWNFAVTAPWCLTYIQ